MKPIALLAALTAALAAAPADAHVSLLPHAHPHGEVLDPALLGLEALALAAFVLALAGARVLLARRRR